MTQLTDEHFELHSKNKAEQFERQKIKFLEDRIKTLENAIESHAKILARFQMTEEDGFKTDLTPDEKWVTHE